MIAGDTLEIASRQIYLYGIDAPEDGQRCQRAGKAWLCGRAATRTLEGLIGGKPVICQVGDDALNGRPVAKCSVDWLDLGAEMVSRGLAIAIERESLDYVQNHGGGPRPGCLDIRRRVHRAITVAPRPTAPDRVHRLTVPV